MSKLIYKVQFVYKGQKVAPLKAIDLFDACLQCMSNFYLFSVKKKESFEAYVVCNSLIVFSIHSEDTPEMVLMKFLNLVNESLDEGVENESF